MKSFAIKDATRISIYEVNGADKDLVCYFPYANAFNLEISADEIYAMAQGKQAVAFDGEVTGSLGFDAEVMSLDLIAVKLGTTPVEGSANLSKREVLTVGTNKVTITGTPVTGSIAVAVLEDGSENDHAQRLTKSATGTPASGEFSIATKEITFATSDNLNGKKVAVYYLQANPNVTKVDISGGEKKKIYEIHAQGMAKDRDGNNVFLDIVIPRASAQKAFTFDLTADSPASLNTTFSLLADDAGSLGQFVFID